MEHVDVLSVGAGLSGIGAAVHLRRALPRCRVLILEGRERIGGTWDVFRYPGVRSDSTMYTLGYSFKPWQGSWPTSKRRCASTRSQKCCASGSA
jgi:monooxygenase